MDGGRVHSCEICNRTFTRKCTFDSHIKRHPQQNGFTEKVHCFKIKVEEFRSLELSTNNFELGKKIRNRESKITNQCTCFECDRSFQRLDLLCHHMVLSHPKSQMIHCCEVCKKVFMSFAKYYTHKKGHKDKEKRKSKASAKKQHCCNICSERFFSVSKLNSHLTKHSADYVHKCEVCKRRFRYYRNLWNHAWVHTDEKPYVCEVCKAGFGRFYRLRNHMSVHSKDELHCCQFCGKKFRFAASCKKHEKTHEKAVVNEASRHSVDFVVHKKREAKKGTKHGKCQNLQKRAMVDNKQSVIKKVFSSLAVKLGHQLNHKSTISDNKSNGFEAAVYLQDENALDKHVKSDNGEQMLIGENNTAEHCKIESRLKASTASEVSMSRDVFSSGYDWSALVRNDICNVQSSTFMEELVSHKFEMSEDRHSKFSKGIYTDAASFGLGARDRRFQFLSASEKIRLISYLEADASGDTKSHGNRCGDIQIINETLNDCSYEREAKVKKFLKRTGHCHNEGKCCGVVEENDKIESIPKDSSSLVAKKEILSESLSSNGNSLSKFIQGDDDDHILVEQSAKKKSKCRHSRKYKKSRRSSPSPRIFRCKLCSKEYKHYRSQIRHMKTVHSGKLRNSEIKSFHRKKPFRHWKMKIKKIQVLRGKVKHLKGNANLSTLGSEDIFLETSYELKKGCHKPIGHERQVNNDEEISMLSPISPFENRLASELMKLSPEKPDNCLETPDDLKPRNSCLRKNNRTQSQKKVTFRLESCGKPTDEYSEAISVTQVGNISKSGDVYTKESPLREHLSEFKEETSASTFIGSTLSGKNPNESIDRKLLFCDQSFNRDEGGECVTLKPQAQPLISKYLYSSDYSSADVTKIKLYVGSQNTSGNIEDSEEIKNTSDGLKESHELLNTSDDVEKSDKSWNISGDVEETHELQDTLKDVEVSGESWNASAYLKESDKSQMSNKLEKLDELQNILVIVEESDESQSTLDGAKDSIFKKCQSFRKNQPADSDCDVERVSGAMKDLVQLDSDPIRKLGNGDCHPKVSDFRNINISSDRSRPLKAFTIKKNVEAEPAFCTKPPVILHKHKNFELDLAKKVAKRYKVSGQKFVTSADVGQKKPSRIQDTISSSEFHEDQLRTVAKICPFNESNRSGPLEEICSCNETLASVSHCHEEIWKGVRSEDAYGNCHSLKTTEQVVEAKEKTQVQTIPLIDLITNEVRRCIADMSPQKLHSLNDNFLCNQGRKDISHSSNDKPIYRKFGISERGECYNSLKSNTNFGQESNGHCHSIKVDLPYTTEEIPEMSKKFNKNVIFDTVINKVKLAQMNSRSSSSLNMPEEQQQDFIGKREVIKKTYECHPCSKKYMAKSSLRRHLKKCYSQQTPTTNGTVVLQLPYSTSATLQQHCGTSSGTLHRPDGTSAILPQPFNTSAKLQRPYSTSVTLQQLSGSSTATLQEPSGSSTATLQQPIGSSSAPLQQPHSTTNATMQGITSATLQQPCSTINASFQGTTSATLQQPCSTSSAMLQQSCGSSSATVIRGGRNATAHDQFNFVNSMLKKTTLFPSKTGRNEKLFKCAICTGRFVSSVGLQKHLDKKVCKPPFHCNFCNKRFRIRSVWEQHMKVENVRIQNREVTCKSCKTVFCSKSDLQVHMMAVVCVKCKREFFCKYFYDMHLKSFSCTPLEFNNDCQKSTDGTVGLEYTDKKDCLLSGQSYENKSLGVSDEVNLSQKHLCGNTYSTINTEENSTSFGINNTGGISLSYGTLNSEGASPSWQSLSKNEGSQVMSVKYPLSEKEMEGSCKVQKIRISENCDQYYQKFDKKLLEELNEFDRSSTKTGKYLDTEVYEPVIYKSQGLSLYNNDVLENSVNFQVTSMSSVSPVQDVVDFSPKLNGRFSYVLSKGPQNSLNIGGKSFQNDVGYSPMVTERSKSDVLSVFHNPLNCGVDCSVSIGTVDESEGSTHNAASGQWQDNTSKAAEHCQASAEGGLFNSYSQYSTHPSGFVEIQLELATQPEVMEVQCNLGSETQQGVNIVSVVTGSSETKKHHDQGASIPKTGTMDSSVHCGSNSFDANDTVKYDFPYQPVSDSTWHSLSPSHNRFIFDSAGCGISTAEVQNGALGSPFSHSVLSQASLLPLCTPVESNDIHQCLSCGTLCTSEADLARHKMLHEERNLYRL